MGFKSNFNEATEMSNNLKPEGDYEVIITKIEERQTKSGAVGLNFSMVIRNDVQQGYKNGYIFLTLWRRKEPSSLDLQVNGYSFGQIMNIAQSAGLSDGKDYRDLAELLAELKGRPLKVTLKHEEYNNKKREIVEAVNKTSMPVLRHVFKTTGINVYASQPSQAAPQQRYEQPPLPTDDDLPF